MHLGGPGSPVPGGISAVGTAAQLRAATAPQVPMVPRTHAFTNTLTRPPRSRQTPTYFDDPRDAGQGGELVGRSLAGGGGHQTQEGGLGGRRAWQGRPRPGSSRATPLSPHWSPLWPHPGGLRPVSGGLRDQELPQLCQAQSCQGVSLTRHVKMRRGLYTKPRKVSKDPAGELASVSKAQAQAPPCRPPGDSAPWARPQGPGLGLCSDTCPRSSPPPPLPVQGTELPSEQGQSTPAPASQLPAGTGGTWAKGHAGKVCALRRGRGREPLRRRGSRGVRGPRGLGLPRRWHPQGPGCPSLTLPTEGKPISATRASPDFMTSKPSPLEEADLEGSSSWARYLASFAFSRPRWYSVAEDTSQTELSVWAGAARGPRAPAGWPDGPAAEALRRCPWLSLHLEQRPGSLLSPLNTVSRCHGGSGGGGRGTPGVSSEVAEGISRAGQGDQLPKEVTRVAQAQGEAGSGSLGPELLLCTDTGWMLCVC